MRCIDHQQQLHEVVCGWKGRLDDEYGASADAFVISGLKLAIAELQNGRISQFRAETFGYFFGQIARLAAGKKFEFVNRHDGYVLRYALALQR